MSRTWSKDDKSKVAELAGVEDVEIIASKLSRSVSAVLSYCQKNGISIATRRKRYTAKQDVFIAEEIAKGTKKSDIAAALGVDKKSLYQHIDVMKGRE